MILTEEQKQQNKEKAAYDLFRAFIEALITKGVECNVKCQNN
jgi:hypothetical protein